MLVVSLHGKAGWAKRVIHHAGAIEVGRIIRPRATSVYWSNGSLCDEYCLPRCSTMR